MGFSDLVSKALNLISFVDLNNPVIVFKCNQMYVNLRISLFTDEKPAQAKVESERDAFLKLMRDVEPFEKEKINKSTPASVDEQFSPDILDYADTLTTWV